MNLSYLAQTKQKFAALKKAQKIYVSLIGALFITMVVLSFVKKLFWLNLISTFLAFASGGLGSLSKTTEEKDGRSRLTRSGWILLVLFGFSCMTAVVTTFIQRSNDRKADAEKEQQFLKQEQLITDLKNSITEQNSELRRAQADLEKANAKLDVQNMKIKIQENLLKRVGRQIQEGQTSIHSVSLSWRLWFRPRPESECMSEFLRISEEPFKEKNNDGFTTKKFPELQALSDPCRVEIERSLGESRVDVRFYRSPEELEAMDRTSFAANQALKFGKGWSFSVYANHPYQHWSYYSWDSKRNAMVLLFDTEIPREELKRPDGTGVSLYDLSQAGVAMRFQHLSLSLISDEYGVDCATFVFNRLLPYGFGSKGVCRGNFRAFLSEETASYLRAKASYTASLPKIIE